LVITPVTIKIQPRYGGVRRRWRENAGGGIVRIGVGVEGGIPERAAVCVVEEEAGGEVEAGDCVVVLAVVERGIRNVDRYGLG
jgi:hypothetical protein